MPDTELRRAVPAICLALLLVGAGCSALDPAAAPSPSPTEQVLASDCERGPTAVEQGYNVSTETGTTSERVEWVKQVVETDASDAVVRGHDSGVVVAGGNEMAKFSPSGERVWEARGDWPDGDFGRDLVRSSDGGYVGVGTTDSDPDYESGAWVLHLNGTGREVWNRSLSDTYPATAIVRTPDGEYVVAGAGETLTRLDAGGEQVWRTELDRDVRITSLARTTDGRLVVGGSIDTDRAEYPVVLGLGRDRSVRWCRALVGAEWREEAPSSVAATADGGVVLTGYQDTREGLGLWRLDADGETRWLRSYGEGPGGASVLTTDDGTIAVAPDGGNAALVEVAPDGEYRRAVSYDGGFAGRDLVRTHDGGYVLVGSGPVIIKIAP